MPAPATPPVSARPCTRETLLALRGADADGRLRLLAAARGAVRPRLAALSCALVRRRAHARLGFRSLGDYARERLGVGSRVVREWARVWDALARLPVLRAAVLSGEVSWSAARRAVALATPETDAACAESLRHRTVRAVDAMLRAVAAASEPPARVSAETEPFVTLSAPISAHALPRWHYALELARRSAGASLPVWECAELIAAEALSAFGAAAVPGAAPAANETDPMPTGSIRGRRSAPDDALAWREHGLRHAAFPCVRWLHAADPRHDEALAALGAWALEASAHELDAALRREICALQRIDAELGDLLREILGRRLYRELGYERFDRYVEERTDVAPRTARRWVRLARGDSDTRAVATAFRGGQITGLQAEVVLPVAMGDAPAWISRAQATTLRGLEDAAREAQASAEPHTCVVRFRAPESVAIVFRSAIEAVRRNLEAASTPSGPGSRAAALAWMLEHAIATWEAEGEQFRDYADFGRDGWRCTAPGCTARRNLQSHHVVFRSRGGPDVPSNRTTLCAFHHLRGIHAGIVACEGRAPGALTFSLGLRPGGDALLRARSGDVLVS